MLCLEGSTGSCTSHLKKESILVLATMTTPQTNATLFVDSFQECSPSPVEQSATSTENQLILNSIVTGAAAALSLSLPP